MDQRSLPSNDNSSIGPEFLAILGSVFFTSLLLYVLRIYARLRPSNRLNSSDYVISLAVFIEVIISSLLAAAIAQGLGRYDSYVSSEEKVNISRFVFGGNLMGSWVSCLTRSSVALMLLQFDISIPWRVTLWVAIGFQLAVAFSSTVTLLLICHPVRSMWEDVPDAKCWTPKQSSLSGYVSAGIQIISDMAFALMPMFIIWKLNRPVLERILVSVLMGLGLFATASVAVKVHLSTIAGVANEGTYRQMLRMILWCRLEEYILIAGACAPLLKSLVERGLKRLGVASFKPKTRELNSLHFSFDITGEQLSGEQSRKDKHTDGEEGAFSSKSESSRQT